MEHAQTIPELRKEGENAPDPDSSEFLAANAPDATLSDPGPRRRRRGRTTLLIAAAAVLGVIAGAATGYGVQYHRPPSPLAPLAQQELATPKPVTADDSTTYRSVNANRWDTTDDDLTKLLLEAPKGAKEVSRQYESVGEWAASWFDDPGRGFSAVNDDGVRRVAVGHWYAGDRTTVTITLLQFRDRPGAESFARGQSGYMPDPKEGAGNQGVPLADGLKGTGRAWVYSQPHQKDGYMPLYEARSIARVGDIVMYLEYLDNTGSISEKDIADLAKRQVEQL
ncbi:hypothetical protein [Streptomyces sp. G-G2]|uniref:hypothetical protein n=1 Tax=Streptomyces sp. G-G2 TaxID=3046201 RepID=UPI0024BA484C|nr:hypothetical protein [Streptomyces sp. G-G2]MDJ0384085.1 hypothetical protein [Streptomyces sp. G-G2]